MNIGADLRLTFPVKWSEQPNGKPPVPLVWAYHIPIGRELFEMHWRIISATATVLLSKNRNSSLLSIATLALKDEGRRDAAEYGLPPGMTIENGGTAAALLGELKRLTTILAPGVSGYDVLPVDQAISRNAIDGEDWSEAEAALVFFTCVYATSARGDRLMWAGRLASVLAGSISSSTASDFAASLSALTPDTTSEPVLTAEASLPPS